MLSEIPLQPPETPLLTSVEQGTALRDLDSEQLVQLAARVQLADGQAREPGPPSRRELAAGLGSDGAKHPAGISRCALSCVVALLGRLGALVAEEPHCDLCIIFVFGRCDGAASPECAPR